MSLWTWSTVVIGRQACPGSPASATAIHSNPASATQLPSRSGLRREVLLLPDFIVESFNVAHHRFDVKSSIDTPSRRFTVRGPARVILQQGEHGLGQRPVV